MKNGLSPDSQNLMVKIGPFILSNGKLGGLSTTNDSAPDSALHFEFKVLRKRMADQSIVGFKEDISKLEEYLDKQTTQNKKSPQFKAQKVPNALKNKTYKSQLDGWSPAHQSTAADLTDQLDDLTLGPAAATSASTKPHHPLPTIPTKKKLTKKERRELQEAQRLAKASGMKGKIPQTSGAASTKPNDLHPALDQGNSINVPLGTNNSSGPSTTQRGKSSSAPLQYDDAKKLAKRNKGSIIHRTAAQKQMALFSHLPQYERESSLSLNVGFSSTEVVHPAILNLGLNYAEGRICGSNARTIAMLQAFKAIIRDYKTPENKMLNRDLDKKLRGAIQFLIDCRPHSISMGNAIRYVRNIIAQLSPDYSEEDAKASLCGQIDTYIQERIIIAAEGIVANGALKIVHGDVILTYMNSTVIQMLFKRAKDQGTDFQVIICDSRPQYEGKILLRALSEYGIRCTYILITALGYIMKDVTKVFQGAAAFMSNGAAVAQVGTATVAMTARAFNVPVIFCCETYKFSDRVQLDSITQNELGDPDELVTRSLVHGDILSDWRDIRALKLLNLIYDVTPINYVSMVVTEAGMTPPTSIPVLIREYRKENNWQR